MDQGDGSHVFAVFGMSCLSEYQIGPGEHMCELLCAWIMLACMSCLPTKRWVRDEWQSCEHVSAECRAQGPERPERRGVRPVQMGLLCGLWIRNHLSCLGSQNSHGVSADTWMGAQASRSPRGEDTGVGVGGTPHHGGRSS